MTDKNIEHFVTPKEYQEMTHKYEDLSGPNGNLLFVSCDSGKELARKVRDEYLDITKKITDDFEKSVQEREKKFEKDTEKLIHDQVEESEMDAIHKFLDKKPKK